jgi:Zn-dependent protease with chaperone function
MKTMFLIAFFFMEFSFAQNAVIIDTTNNIYRASLKEFYDFQTLKNQAILEVGMPRKIRNQFEEMYLDNKKDFISLIDKGVFFESKNYSSLLESIFERLKNNNSELASSDIKLLLAFSDESNAYNNGENIVVINLPLLRDLKNEYQLAFVISHEIAHQKLNHVHEGIVKRLNKYNSEELLQKTKSIDKQKFNKGALASELMKNLVYGDRRESRKKEIAADSLGYLYYSKAYPDFNLQAVEALKILKNSDVASDSLDKSDFIKIFNSQNLKFNEEWLKSDLVNKYNYQKDKKKYDVDSLRTHPDCDVRISYLTTTFNIKSISQKIESGTYEESKKEIDKEYVFGLYFLEEYGKSLYHSLLKYKQDLGDTYYRNMIYENLIKLREYRMNYTLNKYLETENPNFSEGYNQFLNFIRNLRRNELNELILNFTKS